MIPNAPDHRSPDRSRERGIALVLVLWTLALMATLVLVFLGSGNAALRIARNEHAAADASALAESGLSLALLRLMDANSKTNWRVGAYQFTYCGGAIAVRIEDENGKIDLNMAPPELLAGLFRTLGESDEHALLIAGAIIAWRGGEGGKPGGDDAGLTSGRQFLDIRELAQVPGLDRDLIRRASPFLTVYGFSPYINPMTASAEVLRSLPGVDPDAVDQFVRERLAASDPASIPALTGANDIAVGPLSVVRITATAQSNLGARFTREAVVSLNAVGNTPYTILAWGRPPEDAGGSGAP